METLLSILDNCESIKMYVSNGEHFAYVVNKDNELKSFEGWYSCEAMLGDILEWLTKS